MSQGTGLPVVNGNGRKGESTNQDTDNKESSSPSAAAILDGSAGGDTDLDDRLRSALDALECGPRGSCGGGNGYLLAGRMRTGNTVERKPSEGSSSDSEGDEVCPNAMGYMPLPQDPDAEEDSGCDCLNSGAANMPNVPVEGIQERVQIQLQEEPEDAIPRASAAKTVDLKEGKVQEKESNHPLSNDFSALPNNIMPGGINLCLDYGTTCNVTSVQFFCFADEVEAIKKVMSGFTLPSSAMPEWAKHVPEEVWKTELIDRLQHGKKKEHLTTKHTHKP